MATMYYDKDADLALIQGKKVAVIGYGSQGHAHALNLKESGVSVRVGLPATSRSRAKAQAAGLQVGDVADVSKWHAGHFCFRSSGGRWHSTPYSPDPVGCMTRGSSTTPAASASSRA